MKTAVIVPCSVDDCGRSVARRKWCNRHYLKWKRYGDPMANPLAPESRFWSKVEKSDTCWRWTGARFTEKAGGYAQFWLEGKTVKAHIWAYRNFVAAIPPGMQVDHRCRNRICVRPDHLRLATNKQNQENRGANANNPTGIRGVRRLPSGRWNTRVRHNGVEYTAGSFDTAAAAESAVIVLRNELFTHNSLDRRAV